MSNEIIKVLDDLAQRFGVAIDWTAENVLPYLKEIFGKLVTYNIVRSAIAVGVATLLLIVVMSVVWRIYKDYKESKKEQKSNFFWWYSYGSPSLDDDSYWAIAVTIIVAVVSIVVFWWGLDNLLNWSIMPEIQIFEWVSRNIKF